MVWFLRKCLDTILLNPFYKNLVIRERFALNGLDRGRNKYLCSRVSLAAWGGGGGGGLMQYPPPIHPVAARPCLPDYRHVPTISIRISFQFGRFSSKQCRGGPTSTACTYTVKHDNLFLQCMIRLCLLAEDHIF
jgi:hypothetical protein